MEDWKFKVSLGYILKPCLKKTERNHLIVNDILSEQSIIAIKMNNGYQPIPPGSGFCPQEHLRAELLQMVV